MKRIYTKIALSALASIALLGCGGNGKDTKKENTTLTQRTAKDFSQFHTLMKQWSIYGFDVNQTSPTEYVLTIKDGQKAATLILNAVGFETLDEEVKQEIAQKSTGLAFLVQADKDKYTHTAPDSVYVAFLGKGDEKGPIKTLIDAKKLGAYLTLDAHDTLKKARFNDIDETFNENNTTTHITFQGTTFDARRFSLQTPEKNSYLFQSRTLGSTMQDDKNGSIMMGYEGFSCDVDKTNRYLGRVECKLQAIRMENELNMLNEPMYATLNDIAVASNSHKTNGTVSSESTFQVGKIAFTNHKGNTTVKTPFTFDAEGFQLRINVEDMNETVLDKLTALQAKPPKDEKRFLKQALSLAGQLYSRLTFDVTYGLQKLTLTSPKVNIKLNAFQAEGEGKLDSTIRYKEKETLADISIKVLQDTKPLFEMKNVRFGYGVDNLYNFVPSFMTLAAEIATDENNVTDTIVEKRATEMGEKVVHHGLSAFVDPVGWDALVLKNSKKDIVLDKLDFALHAKLDANTVPLDFENPLTAMMLFNYFHANGKLVLKQKDMQTLAQILPPQIGMTLMMFAKQQGEDAVFELKFENGKLTVNGQPLM